MGGTLALAIRAELFGRVCSSGIRSSSTSSPRCTAHHGVRRDHAGLVGFANWQVPMMIGAPTCLCAPEQLELLAAAWGAAAGGIVLRAGWRDRPPAGPSTPALHADGPGMDFAIFALHIMGASSIMGSINIITTISTCARRE